MSAESVSRAWSWRKAVTRSDLMPTTRHVLLTLSLHMNEHGEGCFPPVEDLVLETGLSKRAVLEHLNRAIDAGWLTRHELGLRGRRWRRSEYQPAWPGRVVDVDMAQGDDGRSPPHSDDVVTQGSQGGDPNDREVVTDDHRVCEESIQESRKSPKLEREGAREPQKKPEPKAEDDHDFQKLLKRYPGVHSPGLTFPPWQRLDAEGRRRALARLDAYLADRRKLKNDTVFALQRYLGERLFDQVDEPADGKPVQTLAPVRSKEFWLIAYREAESGKVRKFSFDMARDQGVGLSVPIADLPKPEELAALVSIETDSEAFHAWRRWFGERKLRFRETDTHICGKFIYLPTLWPPGYVHDPPDTEDRESESEDMQGEGMHK